MAAARYEIRIAADGFASQKKRRVYLQKSSFLIFELTPLVRMEGRVVDFWGKGVPGARLFTSRVTHDVYARRTADRTEADPDGYFSFDSLPGEGEYSLTALHARYGAVSRTVSLPTEKSVRVRMGEPLPEIAMAVVEGQVSQPAGEPIPEATVTGMLLTQTSTSRDGRFRSAPVRPGKIGVWARAEGFVTTRRNSLNLQVDEGETADVELVLAPAVPFFGKVTSRDGEPVVRATVLVGVRKSGGYAAYTDPDGTFSIRQSDARLQPPPRPPPGLSLLPRPVDASPRRRLHHRPRARDRPGRRRPMARRHGDSAVSAGTVGRGHGPSRTTSAGDGAKWNLRNERPHRSKVHHPPDRRRPGKRGSSTDAGPISRRRAPA